MNEKQLQTKLKNLIPLAYVLCPESHQVKGLPDIIGAYKQLPLYLELKITTLSLPHLQSDVVDSDLLYDLSKLKHPLSALQWFHLTQFYQRIRRGIIGTLVCFEKHTTRPKYGFFVPNIYNKCHGVLIHLADELTSTSLPRLFGVVDN